MSLFKQGTSSSTNNLRISTRTSSQRATKQAHKQGQSTALFSILTNDQNNLDRDSSPCSSQSICNRLSHSSYPRTPGAVASESSLRKFFKQAPAPTRSALFTDALLHLFRSPHTGAQLLLLLLHEVADAVLRTFRMSFARSDGEGVGASFPFAARERCGLHTAEIPCHMT